MRSFSLSLLSGGTVAALVLTASTVFAHIDLVAPVSRYVVNRANGGGGSKECPCGGPVDMIDGNRICDVPAEQSHDANRSTKVTPFEAGSKITISLVEYIDHSGRFRVAFDPEGADMTDFNSHVLLDVPDDNTKKGSGNNPPYTFEVTLPDMACENCTLQVIQDMNGNTTTPVADPSKDSTYYTCADIRLVPKGTMGNDDGMDPADDPMADPPPADNGDMGTNTMGTNTMGTNTGSMGSNAGSNMGTNLGTVPMMGDNTAAGTPTSSTNNGNTSTGVGTLTPAGMMAMGTGNMLAPSNGAPINSSASDSSDSGGGCSIGSSGTRTPLNPFAALAVVGMFGTLAARRRARRAQ
jgi:hypothetical protein